MVLDQVGQDYRKHRGKFADNSNHAEAEEGHGVVAYELARHALEYSKCERRERLNCYLVAQQPLRASVHVEEHDYDCREASVE